MPYRDLFERNYGIFTEEQQERLRKTHMLIVGTGGIGSITAHCLARLGVGRFTLVDFDRFEPSNTNRQAGCYNDTLNRNKAEVTAEQIARINPDADLRYYDRLMTHEELLPLLRECSFVFPAADDFAFSSRLFTMAEEEARPALLVVPSGTWAVTAVIPPGRPGHRKIMGIPPETREEQLGEIMSPAQFSRAARFYRKEANWLPSYFCRFRNGTVPPAQICPSVWLAATLGAREAAGYISGRWKANLSPRYWEISGRSIRKQRVGRPGLHRLKVQIRKQIWRRGLKESAGL